MIKQIIKYVYILVPILLAPSCKTFVLSKKSVQKNPIQLSVFQNDKEVGIKKILFLERKHFSLRFNLNRSNSGTEEFQVAQIAGFQNRTDMDKIKIGMLISDVPCYQPGTGFAGYPDKPYDYFSLNQPGHHYTFFKNNSNNRLELLYKYDKYLRLKFPIVELWYDDKKEILSQTTLDYLYIAVLVDTNLNKKIDAGELYKLSIRFK